MNIKSLLLGSVAALAAVSGARAADAVVVAEPEPMEYVRICDVYGAGFYYVPGTETCLKVGGYLRYDIGVGKGGYGGLIDVTDKRDFDKTHDTYYKRARAALELDARSETELGTLRGYMHINYDWDTVVNEDEDEGTRFTDTAADFGIEHAYIELGGFRVGKTDSMFSTFTGYAGNVIEDDLIAYGPFDTHQISYTFTGGNGFSAAVAVEEGNDIYTLDSYAPHVVAGAGFTQGWGGVSGVVGYDAVFKEWAGKVRLDVEATDQISLFAMVGYGSEKNISHSFYKTWNGKWAVWGGGTYKLNEKLSFNLQASYARGSDKIRTEDGDTIARQTAVVANVAYDVVPGFTVTPELAWNSQRFEDEAGDRHRESNWGGFLRFQRSF
ncbi:porin [Mesorhizobium sp. KR1-2]|uniref:porin n=1 Tax=Mesorhizobium sp. KR1-2 TaxID=3156609 RepID=UPI0032B610F5